MADRDIESDDNATNKNENYAYEDRATHATYGTDGDPDRQGVVGDSDHPQHRAPPGEGVRAPLDEESDSPPQTSIFDGAGNESVVVLGTDDKGRVKEGTGPDLESAVADSKSTKSRIGNAFGGGKH